MAVTLQVATALATRYALHQRAAFKKRLQETDPGSWDHFLWKKSSTLWWLSPSARTFWILPAFHVSRLEPVTYSLLVSCLILLLSVSLCVCLSLPFLSAPCNQLLSSPFYTACF